MPYKSDAQRRAVWAKKTEKEKEEYRKKKKKKKGKYLKKEAKYFRTYAISKSEFNKLSPEQQETLYDLFKDEEWIDLDETQTLVGKYFPNQRVDLSINDQTPVHYISADVPSSSKEDVPVIYLHSKKNPKKAVLHELGHVADYYNEDSALREYDKRNNWFRRLIKEKKLRELHLQLENDAWDWAGIQPGDKLRDYGIQTYKDSLKL